LWYSLKIRTVSNLKENYYVKFINFFKKHNLYDKEVFDYIWDKCNFFNYLEDEYRMYTGVYYVLDKNKKLVDFNLIVPFIDSEKSLLINIHEYAHAIEAFYKLGEKFILDDSCEVNSLFLENLYLLENNNEVARNFLNNLNEIRINSNEKQYVLGIKIADYLLNLYNDKKQLDLNKMSRKNKKLLKKFKYHK